MDTTFLSLLACPKCRGKLDIFEDNTGLLCDQCHVVYPIEDGVPLLLKEKSIPLSEWKIKQQKIEQKCVGASWEKKSNPAIMEQPK